METVFANAPEIAQAAAPRLDIYVAIHKALRAFMTDTLVEVGRVDVEDAAELARIAAQVRGLIKFCRSHLEHENRRVHTAMEARRPGSAAQTADDHRHHERAFERLETSLRALERAGAHARTAAGTKLYRQLALFVAENFEHMHVEEVENNAVLWAVYSDEELMEIEHAIIASIPPAEMAVALRWMIPHLSPAERAALLTDMQSGAPREVFEGVLAMAREHLDERCWEKLAAALGL